MESFIVLTNSFRNYAKDMQLQSSMVSVIQRRCCWLFGQMARYGTGGGGLGVG